jgi:BirA family transcriptional regulator, biotin operon repressor / biotin---[acetyl-CoA-carboxylase] ligase
MAVEILWHKSLDSTNSEVRRHISSLDNLSVVAAQSQSAGRGQGDHKWHSEPGENLTFTLLLKFPPLRELKAGNMLLLTEMITYALREFLASEGITARIKWPNDIYVGDLKICGILIENILDGSNVSASIIGVGLNLNQTDFPSDIPNPTSISLLTGRRYDPARTLERLCTFISRAAALLDSPSGRSVLDDYFNAYMFRKA